MTDEFMPPVVANGNNLSGHNSNPRHLGALRESTKIERRAFTEAVQAFTEYVDRKGTKSKVPERAYSNQTRSIYAVFGINKKQIEARLNDASYGRDNFEAMELLFVQQAERAAAITLWQGMARNDLRSEIKAAVKRAILLVFTTFTTITSGKIFDQPPQ